MVRKFDRIFPVFSIEPSVEGSIEPSTEGSIELSIEEKKFYRKNWHNSIKLSDHFL